jgi:hypothetical protein
MKNAPLAAETRPIRRLELFALVLLWNSGYKGARVLNTLYALELGAKPFESGRLLAIYGLLAVAGFVMRAVMPVIVVRLGEEQVLIGSIAIVARPRKT